LRRAFLAAAAWAGEPPTARLDLRLQGLEGVQVAQVEAGRVILERMDQPNQAAQVLSALASQSLSVPVPSRWQIRFEIPGVWGPSGPLEVDGTTPTAWVFNLRPAGRLAGRLTSRASTLPKSLVIWSELVSGARLETHCPLGPKGEFDCFVPAGRQDLVLAAGSFAPVRFRDRLLSPTPHLLPTTELQPGSSLVGRVSARDGSDLDAAPRALVRIFRFVAARTSITPAAPLAETAVEPGGSFSFVGLPPGPVLLEVTRPGFSPLRISPLELPPGAEVAIPDPLELTRPLEVVVQVSPSADPFGLPWRILFEPYRTATVTDSDGRAEGTTDAEGRWRIPARPAGRATVRVEDSAGNRYYKNSDLWIAEGAEAFVNIELPLLDIRGEVTHGGRPLEATLFFGGRMGGRRIEMTSDAEGRFEGVLPEAGTWPVQVLAEGIDTLVKVAIEPGLDKHRAAVKVGLPDTLVFGRVVDDEGKPVVDAEVFVSAEGWANEFRSGIDGNFEARAVPPGWTSVSAESRLPGQLPRSTDALQLELRDGQPLGPLELQLRRLERIRGTLRDHHDRPLAGAVVSFASNAGSFHADSAKTDIDGHFTIESDPKTSDWTITILPPGGALTVFRRANDGSPFGLKAEAEGGQLRLEFPFSKDEAFARNLEVRLTRDGAELKLYWLLEWLRLLGLPVDQGSDPLLLTVPLLAPGNYTACVRVGLSPDNADRTCQSGQLVAGGKLTLTLANSPD
jgi:hypothetical protein